MGVLDGQGRRLSRYPQPKPIRWIRRRGMRSASAQGAPLGRVGDQPLSYWHAPKRWGGFRPCETAALARGGTGAPRGFVLPKRASADHPCLGWGTRAGCALRPDLCRRLTALDKGGKSEVDRFQGLAGTCSPSPSLGQPCLAPPRAQVGASWNGSELLARSRAGRDWASRISTSCERDAQTVSHLEFCGGAEPCR